jgi:V/A-type H+/Na+-transporting ATPase subunit I
MIVRMKRINLLCLTSGRDATLRHLQEMGVVHLTSLRPPESRALETSRNHLAYIKRALETMPRKTSVPPSGLPADVTVSLVWTLLQDKKDIEDALADFHQEKMRIQPFGSFEPAMIAALRQRNIFIKLYSTSPDVEIKAPEGAVLIEINRSKTGVYLALFARENVSLPVPELRLPDRSLKEIEDQIAEYNTRLEDCITSLKQHEGDHEAVAALRDKLDDTVRFLEARDGMGSAAPVAFLRGYLPAEQTEAMLEAARNEGWGVQIEDPRDDEDVPTLIRNPVWVKPIKAVLDFIGVLPGYKEIDISAIFLFFLSLFFAMLVGDAGYGLIFIGLTWYARRKMPKAPAYPFHLMYVMSICTVIWGAVTGTWFGAGHLPPFLEGLTVTWLREPKNIMLLSFLIGAIHLTFAHLWIIARTWNSLRALAQLGWIGSTWTMFFMARNLVLGQALPQWITFVFIASVVLIILFMTAPRDFKNEWFNHVMLPLNLVSNFVDVVSYIRLFAVGTAGYAVASSFNTMILAGGVDGVLAGLLAAILLFLGHALNILLSVMGVLVHGVRLNTLEFSSHIGMAWTGLPFRPFSKTSTSTNQTCVNH